MNLSKILLAFYFCSFINFTTSAFSQESTCVIKFNNKTGYVLMVDKSYYGTFPSKEIAIDYVKNRNLCVKQFGPKTQNNVYRVNQNFQLNKFEIWWNGSFLKSFDTETKALEYIKSLTH
jgi:hypothetical protein